MKNLAHEAFEAGVIAFAALIGMMLAVGLAFGGMFLLTSKANAQDGDRRDTRWHTQRFCAHYGWDGSCTRYRYERRRTYAHTYRRNDITTYRDGVRYYAAPRDDDWQSRDPRYERGVECKSEVVRVVGSAALSDDAATRAAIRQWQATVAYDMGQKFMNLDNARGYRWRCDRASANESVLGKVGEALAGDAATQKRCVIIARPCMMPMKDGDKDKE